MAVMAALPFVAMHVLLRAQDSEAYRATHWLLDTAAVVFVLTFIAARIEAKQVWTDLRELARERMRDREA